MSIVEDNIAENNLRTKVDNKNAALEHMAELERLRKLEELSKNPKLIAFWQRRKTQTQKLRDVPQKF